MPSKNKEILIPLNDVRHLFFKPDYDPFKDDYLMISGIEYALKQLRMNPLPERVQLNLSFNNSVEADINLEKIKKALRLHCSHVVKEQEEELSYLSWQIKKNLNRALMPFLIMIIGFSSIMYNMMDERSRLVQILLVLLNNGLIILGWVLVWIPSEMYLYGAPRVKREIALYKLLAEAEIHIT